MKTICAEHRQKEWNARINAIKSREFVRAFQDVLWD